MVVLVYMMMWLITAVDPGVNKHAGLTILLAKVNRQDIMQVK